jgi:molecular chaperone DnaK (HSP70)
VSKRVYGIDLGTTYSCIAYVNEFGKPEVIEDIQANNVTTTPSVVYFEPSGNVVVGQDAKESAALYPDRVVSLVKREMGTPWIKQVDDKVYTPQEISRFILEKLAAYAQAKLKSPVEEVVITCPAYFGVNEREATREAGVKARLKVRAIINEPTAAAIAYGMEQGEDQTFLVYDLGGGTFDVTILQVKQHHFEVVAVKGNHRLGGADWDRRIVDWLIQEFANEHAARKADLENNRETMEALLQAAEKQKRGLSQPNRESVSFKVTHGGKECRRQLTRGQFEQMTRDLLDETFALADQALEVAASKGVTKIDQVLLVGGSTLMPQVQAEVQRRFPGANVQLKDPHEIVAKGAALVALREQLVDDLPVLTDGPPSPTQAAKLAELASATGVPTAVIMNLRRLTFEDVLPRSFGVVAYGNNDQLRLFNILLAQQKLPLSFTDKKYCTREDGQTLIQMEVRENNIWEEGSRNGISPEDGLPIGLVEVRLPRPVPKGTPVHVTFSINKEGLLDVEAVVPTTGSVGRVTIERTYA